MKSKSLDLPYFLNFYLNIVSIIAMLSVVQYFATPFGLVSFKDLGVGPEGAVFGFGGAGSFIGPRAMSMIPRNVGFYSEPTNFAQMLMIPLFISYYKTLELKSIKNITQLLIITVAFLLTFSVANFFGFIVGATFYYYMKLRNPNFIRTGKEVKIITTISTLIFIVYAGYSFFQITNENTYNSDVIIGKNTVASSQNRIERILIYYEEVKKHPFGNWSFREKYTSNPGFIGTALLAGGFIFLAFWILFLMNFYKKVYRISARSPFLLIYSGIFAFMLPMIWDVQFMEAQFLFYIALFVTIVKYDSLGLQIFYRNSNRKKTVKYPNNTYMVKQ